VDWRIHSLTRGVSLVHVDAPGLDEVEHARASARLSRALGDELGEGRVVAGGTSVLVEGVELDALTALLDRVRVDASIVRPIETKEHMIEVVYDGADLVGAADHLGITSAELVARHAARRYEVLVSGFLPGFAYLGPLDPALELPRLPTPRRRVPAGSVALAGRLTGVYPFASPGGWNLIGRAPGARLFDASRERSRLFAVGDSVRFVPRERPGAFVTPAPPSAQLRTTRAALRVLRAPPATTIQDLGRPLRRGEGLPSGGALDRSTLRASNLAVGNVDSAAAIEIPLGTFELEALSELTVSVDGARAQRLQCGERMRRHRRRNARSATSPCGAASTCRSSRAAQHLARRGPRWVRGQGAPRWRRARHRRGTRDSGSMRPVPVTRRFDSVSRAPCATRGRPTRGCPTTPSTNSSLERGGWARATASEHDSWAHRSLARVATAPCPSPCCLARSR
jgi:KipI family sensor histidine kinase inhibitor